MVLERLMTESKRISLLSKRDLFIVYCMTGFCVQFFFVATQTGTEWITLIVLCHNES